MRQTRVYTWRNINRLAVANGLILRFHNDVGISPRTFHLGVYGKTYDDLIILKDLSVADVEDNKKLSNGMTLTQTILSNAIRSKK
jgi:hypothetical protein